MVNIILQAITQLFLLELIVLKNEDIDIKSRQMKN